MPWAAAVPDNVDILREKWESVDEATLGWDYVASMAQAHGFIEHIQAGFSALPPLPTTQPAGPLMPADAGRHLAKTFAEEHGRINHTYVPELKVWRKFVDGVWVENHTNLWDISDHLEINAQALLAAGEHAGADQARRGAAQHQRG